MKKQSIFILIFAFYFLIFALPKASAVNPSIFNLRDILQGVDYVVLNYNATPAQHAALILQADTNSIALTATGRTWNAAEANAVDINDNINDLAIYVYFYGDGTGGGSPASASCHLKISGANRYGGLEDIFDCNIAGGTAQLSHNPVSGLQLWAGQADPNYTWGDEWTGLVLDRPAAAVTLVSQSGGIGGAKLSREFFRKIQATVTELSGATTAYVIFYGG